MSNSSVPKIVFGDTGVVLPAEADILAGVQADMNAAFGGKLNPSLETPQGQLASSQTAIIGDKNNEIASVVNNVDPDKAAGRWQDAIARIYFIDRLPAQSTVVPVVCVGLAGTVIPVGAMVSASDGNTYSCLGAGTIPSGGSITLQFACSKTGPIACPAGTITGIYKQVPGWDTASNTADGTLGRDVESRADFEYRRRNSVAKNGVNSLQAIYGEVLNVAGVLDAYVTENNTASAVVNGSITLAAKSIYVAAVGGLDADVAAAIWRKRPPGADYNGNTSVSVQDTNGYSVPYPTYTIKFQRPPAQPIKFAVQIANDSNLPSDIVTQVQNAIILAFSGLDGGPRARIGAKMLASRFYAPVSAIKPGYVGILSLKIGTATATLDSLTVDIGVTPTVSAANIAVTLV